MAVQKRAPKAKRFPRKSVKKTTNTLIPRSKRTSKSAEQRAYVVTPARLVIHRGIGFPSEYITNLVYGDNFVLTGTVSNVWQEKVYKLNSCYDPDDALGGAQPMWFDQVTSIYNRYEVLGAKLTATFTADSAPGSGPWICGVSPHDSNTLPTSDPEQLMLLNNTSTAMIGGDHGLVELSGTYNANDLGLTKGDDSLVANYNANPDRLWYCHVWQSSLGTTYNGPVTVRLRIEYLIRFSARKGNSGS